jgi:hypothetical protein
MVKSEWTHKKRIGGLFVPVEAGILRCAAPRIPDFVDRTKALKFVSHLNNT